MLGDKILAGDSSEKPQQNFVIGSDGTPPTDKPVPKEVKKLSLAERISLSTENGGLNELPEDFDDEHGDWKIVNSANPFENLYLDYKQYKFITPEIVKQNYNLLEKFWKSKFEIMNTGGNRVAFKSKYGDGVVEKSLTICKRAYDKISSTEGIERYFAEINNARIQQGAERLKDNIEQMLRDGSADSTEIVFCFETGVKYNLDKEEIAEIIQKRLDADGFKPYGSVSGNSISEKLLSVESWMTPLKLAEAEALKREKESLKIQIFPGKYAATIEDIGTILFNDPVEAKEIIKDNLLKPAIAQKDIVLAREVGSITDNSKDINGAFFQIIYKLNHTLPFPFAGKQNAKNIQELTTFIFENEQSLKTGKEDLKRGYIENWLKETDKQAHAKLISIRDTAENLDQAFLAMLYSFNPILPYRFAGNIFLKNRTELANEINKNANTWNIGKAELYNGFINTWLQNTGEFELVKNWNKIKGTVPSEDVGLEEFLYILDEKTEKPVLKTSLSRIDYPAIQSGKVIVTDIDINLNNRGYTIANLSFSKDLPGVSLSAKRVFFNAATKDTNGTVKLSIDSLQLLKGIDYSTSILIKTTAQQTIEIPLTFKVIFPKNAFIFQIAMYAVFFAAFFVLIRYLISPVYKGWLTDKFNFFLSMDEATYYKSAFSPWGWIFFLFIAGMGTAIYFLIKYLSKNLSKK